jgi:hypothetical protein
VEVHIGAMAMAIPGAAVIPNLLEALDRMQSHKSLRLRHDCTQSGSGSAAE